MLKKNLIEKIDREAVKRYNKRLKQFGQRARTLGWDTRENQWERFQNATSLINLEGKKILDIGCGFGDLLKFIKEKKIRNSSYWGIDINKELLRIARENHPEAIFRDCNILLDPLKKEAVDVVFALGILNFNLKGRFNNYDYAMELVKRAFSLCKEVLIVDMLSSYRDKNYPKEDFVFYYSPEKMFKFTKTLTSNVVLKHDYKPIPQKEFILFLKK